MIRANVSCWRSRCRFEKGPKDGTGQKDGRPEPGSRNRRTLALEAKAKEAAEKLKETFGGQAFDGDAHALLMLVYKDMAQPMEMRLDAAKAAVRFEKPALSSVDGKGNLVPNYVAYLPRPAESAEGWLAEHGHLNSESAPKPQ